MPHYHNSIAKASLLSHSAAAHTSTIVTPNSGGSDRNPGGRGKEVKATRGGKRDSLCKATLGVGSELPKLGRNTTLYNVLQ